VASIIAAVTALVAVAIGPFLTIRASKTQMLGPMRQAWINSLRDTVVEFPAKVHIGALQSGALLSPDDTVRHLAELARVEHQQQTYQLKAKIALLVNPKEAEHGELMRLTDAAYSAYVGGRDPSVQLLALQRHAQVVLKKEWNVVKK
ncbi:MAG: hypothetical protein NW204_14240, partial [Xanthomonadaceae bacterium]|nr:hypothetical protein [Xanthomonadaceae bacterium]